MSTYLRDESEDDSYRGSASYSGPPESLPKNFELLELMERLRIQGNNTSLKDLQVDYERLFCLSPWICLPASLPAVPRHLGTSLAVLKLGGRR
ncbi:hypothetical protein FOCC_FOCC007133 [Frankliniella occidentalis]|nr:hypothetical protein FOCC_FOCC007133 [Frankliniella occidentalis]